LHEQQKPLGGQACTLRHTNSELSHAVVLWETLAQMKRADTTAVCFAFVRHSELFQRCFWRDGACSFRCNRSLKNIAFTLSHVVAFRLNGHGRSACVMDAMLCYAVLCCHAMLRNACYAMLLLCYVMPHHAMLCYAMQSDAMLCHAVLCNAILCYAMMCNAKLYHDMSRYALPCSAMPFYAMPCCPMLQYTKPCRVVLWFVVRYITLCILWHSSMGSV
jgi:hypothetical protein